MIAIIAGYIGFIILLILVFLNENSHLDQQLRKFLKNFFRKFKKPHPNSEWSPPDNSTTQTTIEPKQQEEVTVAPIETPDFSCIHEFRHKWKEYKKAATNFNAEQFLSCSKNYEKVDSSFDKWDIVKWRKVLHLESKYFVELHEIFKKADGYDDEINEKLDILTNKIKNAVIDQATDQELQAYVDAKKEIENGSKVKKANLKWMNNRLFEIAYKVCACDCRIAAHVPDSEFSAFRIYYITDKYYQMKHCSPLIKFVNKFAHLENIQERRNIIYREYRENS